MGVRADATRPSLGSVMTEGFAVGEAVPGPYLHRWGLELALRPVEVAAIARGELTATGARLVARRR